MDIDDDGILKVTIGGVSVPVDVYHVWNRIGEITTRTEDRPVYEFHAAVVELLRELGFPAVSHRAADRFVRGLHEHIDALKKAETGGPTPGSPGTTGPRPSDCPPG